MSFLKCTVRTASVGARRSLFTSVARRTLNVTHKTRLPHINTRLFWGAATVVIATGTLLPTIYLDSLSSSVQDGDNEVIGLYIAFTTA